MIALEKLADLFRQDQAPQSEARRSTVLFELFLMGLLLDLNVALIYRGRTNNTLFTGFADAHK